MSKNAKAVSGKVFLGTYLKNCEIIPGQELDGKRLKDGSYPLLQFKEGVTSEGIAEQMGMNSASFGVRASQERTKFNLKTTIVKNGNQEITVDEYCRKNGKKLSEIDLEAMTVVHGGMELPKFKGKSAESFDVDSALDDLLADVD